MSGRPEDTPTMRHIARYLKDAGHAFSSEILIGEFISKLRPGARQFLAKANEKFSVYVHTKGKKGYKKWLLSEIDPTGKIFPPGVVDRLASYQDVYVLRVSIAPCDWLFVCVLALAMIILRFSIIYFVKGTGMRKAKWRTKSSCSSQRR
jgi:hypothetical protein